jgi:hypothetical protein
MKIHLLSKKIEEVRIPTLLLEHDYHDGSRQSLKNRY